MDWLHTKEPYICDAVANAILNKCTNDVAGARIYVTVFPDCESAKVIIQSRIEEVVVLGEVPKHLELEKETEEVQAGRKLLEMARVKVRYFSPTVSSLTLDFVAKMSPSTIVMDDDMPNDVADVEQEKKKRKVSERCTAKQMLMEEANYDATKVDDNGKRKDVLCWEDYL